MPSITIKQSGRTFEYTPGGTLLEILLAQDIFVDNPCNGKGVCGKCRVRILEGAPEATTTEEQFLKPEDIASGVRLSCMVEPTTDLVIELMQKELHHDVLTGGFVPDFDFNTDVRKALVEIHKPTLEDQTPFEDQIRQQLGLEKIAFDAVQVSRFEQGTMTAVIHDDAVIAIEQGDTTGEVYGVAIDIGTTTVVCSLVDMLTGKELASSSMVNAQKTFGLDVLTRITYEMENPEEGIEKLQKAIVDSINDMIADTLKKSGVSLDHIYEIAVGANCTMMHMLLGVDATPIGKAPYAPMFVKAKDLEASSIGLRAATGARLYCLPSVSAYIGADIVAGAYVCDLQHEEGNALFIDIGTNGEIVLSSHGKLLCCSCAAGPALEGMNISSGMRAEPGAIEDVVITENGIELKTIGDTDPIGICGSGILAVVKELLKCGLVKKTGAFIKKEKLAEDDYRYDMVKVDESGKRALIMVDQPEELLITQGDVRQVQLAKGAILSGFVALLNKAGIEMKDLDKVLIAGQFGAHLPAESMTGTGILPEEVGDRLEYVGNSSKTGAYMALMSKDVKKEMEELAHNMDYMELGATEGYERLFSDSMIFPTFKQR